jgi:hypothetical protein
LTEIKFGVPFEERLPLGGRHVLGKGQRLARAARAVLGKYRLETAQEEQHKGMPVARKQNATKHAKKGPS